MPRERLPLLEALSALKPNTIYTLAPPKAIASAAAYFSKDPLKAFRWGASGKLLEAEIGAAATPILVRFTCEGGILHGVCDCTKGGASNCRHALAVAMTIVRVLHGARFHRDDLPPKRLEKFRRQLKAPVPETVPPRVILSSGGPGGRFALDYDSGRREATWLSTGAPPGMEWLGWQDRQPEKVAASFGRWLSGKPGEIEIVVRTPEEEFSFAAAEWRSIQAATLLELECDRERGGMSVSVRRAVLDGEDGRVERFVDLGYGMVLLPDRAVFAEIRPPEAWAEFARMRPSASSSDVFTIQAAAFCLCAPSWPALTLLDHGKSPVQPREVPCHGMMLVTTGKETVQVRLRAGERGGDDGDGREWPVHRELSRYFQELIDGGAYALLLKSPSRRRRIVEFLGRLVRAGAEAGDETQALLLEASRDPAFTSYQMHGEEAMNCLRAVLGHLRAMDEPHLLADPGRPEAPWLSCAGAGTALGRTVAVLAETFPEEDLLQSKDLLFEMEESRFFQGLSRLAEGCARLSVALRVDGRKARAATLDLSVRATRSGVIDWFELHPEARAGRFTIPREHWAELLRTGRYASDDQTFVAFDEASLGSLRRLSGLLEDAGGAGPRIPRLRLFDWLALRAQGVRCELPPEEEAVLQSLLHLDQIPAQPLPAGLCAEMREYQRHGYDWLAFLYRHRFGACLADDMGLGKTVQTIALLAALKEGIIPRDPAASAPTSGRGTAEPHLVVLPPTLLFNWQSEIERFAPSLKVREYTGQSRTADFAGIDLVLTTYDLARRDIETLSRVAFDVIVFDEAQAVKNAAAARTRALGRLNGRFRVCLTGTPLENHVGEFHSIMEAAVPGLLGDRKRFIEQYGAGFPVLARAKPFLLRRTKEKILSELPPQLELDAYFALSERQKECYTRAVGEVRREVLAAYEDRPAQQAGIAALAALMRLRQICIAPAMLPGESDESSPKLEYLVEQLAELTEEGHAAVVFSQFVKALDLAGRALESAGLPFLRLDGSTPTPRRKELVEAFQSGRSPGIFLISLKTGGAGLNLPRASYVYHLDPWWNPAVEMQANARVHRIGQKKGVYVQRLLMRHTVEEKMMLLKQRKEALFKAVVENGETVSATGAAALSADDFRFLVESL